MVKKALFSYTIFLFPEILHYVSQNALYGVDQRSINSVCSISCIFQDQLRTCIKEFIYRHNKIVKTIFENQLNIDAFKQISL